MGSGGVDTDIACGDCRGLHECVTCGYVTAQARKCPRCGDRVECQE